MPETLFDIKGKCFAPGKMGFPTQRNFPRLQTILLIGPSPKLETAQGDVVTMSRCLTKKSLPPPT